MEMKQIKVSLKVHKKLGDIGRKNETYNDIVERVLNDGGHSV